MWIKDRVNARDACALWGYKLSLQLNPSKSAFEILATVVVGIQYKNQDSGDEIRIRSHLRNGEEIWEVEKSAETDEGKTLYHQSLHYYASLLGQVFLKYIHIYVLLMS